MVEEQLARIEANNIGGISNTEVEIPPGTTILSGRNATNRTSFLHAIMAAMGSSKVSVKGDSETGYVELTIGDETHTRKLKRLNGTIQMNGDPYLQDSTVADLFSFLLETNEARRAVVRSDNLRDLIMKPIDTDQIEHKVKTLEGKRDEIEEELDKLENLKSDLPGLEGQRNSLKDQIENKREELVEKESEIELIDADIQSSRNQKEELEELLGDLQNLRSELETVRSNIEIEQESIESLKKEKSHLSEEFDKLSDSPMGEYEELDERISKLRERKQNIEGKISNTQDVVDFNKRMLEEESRASIKSSNSFGDETEAVTNQLIEDERVNCWTCRTDVAKEKINETIDEMQSVVQDRVNKVYEIEGSLSDLREKQNTLKQQQQRRNDIEQKLENISEEIEDRENKIDELRENREQLSQDVETTEEKVEKLESEEFSEILDLHKEANQLEFELGQLESELDNVVERISDIEERLDEETELRNQLDEIREELEEQRTRIERIEQEAVGEFNDHMEDVLSLLAYENLERIWLERIRKTAREGRQTVEKTVFDLHVVRRTESGTTYEDTIDHLSESEREVTGLIFALAGYLVHNVYEKVPFMLLDSLEAIDSERLADLIDYFSDYPQYLVVALLPEDAQALSNPDTFISDI
ncbi:archaea-specific SMC-related protein [Halorubrum vacuolatum]|uniref:Rad50/SbcC-type AAA domain-containing protein n=1 Tax=Halorubrum vacuolatum TaxID=63740 RepID=A0A238XGH0_HALVU|nr:archaea-specific SMC-related protein [Halorubrum vacuolatum]SNR57810.1 hypothetical protein SAMN06264855_11751 [Halorubrum vacuolatum]